MVGRLEEGKGWGDGVGRGMVGGWVGIFEEGGVREGGGCGWGFGEVEWQ